jgi:hypothetical protein
MSCELSAPTPTRNALVAPERAKAGQPLHPAAAGPVRRARPRDERKWPAATSFCIDSTKKLPAKASNAPWPPCGDEALGERRPTLIKMDAAVKAKVEKLFNPWQPTWGLKLKGLKARRKTAQGTRSESSAARGREVTS